ncbi:MAG: desulfoferrodoxin [Clostridiales bacterium]|nr:desulfoferrodoxin [Clostridiales bacterium]
MKIYRCTKCGQMVAAVKKKGCDIMCCGQPMEQLVPNTQDAAQEKHVPVFEVKDGIVSVKVGSAAHPMTEAHYIEWILLRTDRGNQRKPLSPTDAPEAQFALLPGEKVENVYAYCNLHGLWMA